MSELITPDEESKGNEGILDFVALRNFEIYTLLKGTTVATEHGWIIKGRALKLDHCSPHINCPLNKHCSPCFCMVLHGSVWLHYESIIAYEPSSYRFIINHKS